ncbi:hypothetical protein JOE64_001633 [Microbacterium dextranolyticum]|nr:hypothetical protein [Microbacterium dextranolyticum]
MSATLTAGMRQSLLDYVVSVGDYRPVEIASGDAQLYAA